MVGIPKVAGNLWLAYYELHRQDGVGKRRNALDAPIGKAPRTMSDVSNEAPCPAGTSWCVSHFSFSGAAHCWGEELTVESFDPAFPVTLFLTADADGDALVCMNGHLFTPAQALRLAAVLSGQAWQAMTTNDNQFDSFAAPAASQPGGAR